jgi:arylsulfatase A-like enzyme
VRVPQRRSARGAALVTAVLAFLPPICLFAGSASQLPSPQRQNVLLIVVDAMRFDAGLKGSSDPDAAVPPYLKQRGRHFIRALSVSTWTLPSMTAMLTGQYPPECGVLSVYYQVHAPRPPLAERLRSLGYTTSAVVSNPMPGLGSGLERGFDAFDQDLTKRPGQVPEEFRTAEATTDAALRQLGRLAKAGNPWFLWVHYLEPHGPYVPPRRFLRPPRDPGPPIPLSGSELVLPGMIPNSIYLADCRGRNDYVARYQANARYALSEVERLLETASSSGQLARTMVVFTADHGEFLGEEDYWCQHGVMIDPALVHVPLVIARSSGESRSEEHGIVSQIDLAPSILDAAAGQIGQDLRGESLFSPRSRRREPIFVDQMARTPASLRLEEAVVIGSLLCVFEHGRPESAFRLDGAAWAESKPSPQVARQARAALIDYQRVSRPGSLKSRAFTSEQIRRLRALGYLGGP